MDSSKVQQILNWPQPKNIKALQSFLGFASFYRSFIKNYSKKITSLTSLLKKDSPFIFNEKALSQFQSLKKSFTTAPILSHFNPSLPTIVQTDASDYALGAVLSQVNDSAKHLIAFDSRKLLPAELNYEIHDKELLGIIWALKRWRAFLLSRPILLRSLQTTLPCRTSCLPNFVLVVRPVGLSFFQNFTSLSLTIQAGCELYQMPCHVGTTYTQ
ncbi:hypothetical protein O181_126771 [Austropuccinia psidii MF-1]|uniref:Reverse transcriptase/retrotransposon-derived protein RNase H-like domain-containing protein n=1 Tax=Austropuccinia psidii MF-1 TaxID=1389203 RepID=A0A9Q3KUW4_9BASI|nr:hypothetical protein [Austropuccinia psidii MF-1]